jgi:hypothetical protein
MDDRTSYHVERAQQERNCAEALKPGRLQDIHNELAALHEARAAFLSQVRLARQAA